MLCFSMDKERKSPIIRTFFIIRFLIIDVDNRSENIMNVRSYESKMSSEKCR